MAVSIQPFKNYIRNTAPPRVVFVIGCVSCNKFSHFRGNERKKSANTLEVCVASVERVPSEISTPVCRE